MNRHREGVIYAAGAYLLWGVLPIYWKLLQSVAAVEILAHRIVWSLVLLGVMVLLRREWGVLRAALADLRRLRLYAAAAVLLALNWGTYIWSVNAGHIVETSLGYYINPLVSVMLAVVFLGERLRRLQWFAVGLAFLGVVQLTLHHGHIPWIALVLAFSFGLYGLAKRLSPLAAVAGLALETAILAPGALVYLGWVEFRGDSSFGHAGGVVTLLLVLAGGVTSLPLLLFAHAAQRVPLSTLGLLQYIAPSCALVIGVGLYHESFPRGRAVGFALIWGALGLYWLEAFVLTRRSARR